MNDNLANQTIIYALTATADGSDAPRIFAAASTGLTVSTDNGASWRDALASLELIATLPVGSVATSPAFSADKTVCAGALGGILRSSDGGETWQIVEFPTPPPFIASLVFSPDFERDGVIFAGALEDGIFVSRDRGYRWHAWNFGLLDLNVLALAVSPNYAQDETIYAAVESGIFRSDNGGRAWREIPFDIDCAPVISLAISPQFTEDGVLYAGAETHGLFKSTDGGQTWVRLAPDLIQDSVDAIVLSPDYPAKPQLLVLSDGDVLISRDDGESWQSWPGAETITEPVTTMLAPAGLDDGARLLVGTAGGGVQVI